MVIITVQLSGVAGIGARGWGHESPRASIPQRPGCRFPSLFGHVYRTYTHFLLNFIAHAYAAREACLLVCSIFIALFITFLSPCFVQYQTLWYYCYYSGDAEKKNFFRDRTMDVIK